MKSYLIVLSLICCSHWTFAQNPVQQDKTSEVEIVNKNLALAYEYYQAEDFRKAIETATLVTVRAGALGLTDQLNKSINLISRCHQILTFQKSRDRSSDVGSMAIALQLSDFYLRNGEYEKAIQFATEVYKDAAQSGNKSFMASALNKEAKAILNKNKGSKQGREEASQKFRSSLNLLNENNLHDPLLKIENLDYLGEEPQTPISALEFAKATGGIKITLDSVNSVLDKWSRPESYFRTFVVDMNDTTDGIRSASYENEWKNRHSPIYDKIIVYNRNRMAKDLISPLPASSTTNLTEIVGHVADEMKDLWPVEVEKLKKEISDNENRIERLTPNRVREELMVATYKNKYDSLQHLHTLDSIYLDKQELSIQRQEAEMQRQKAKRNLMMTSSGGTLLLAMFFLVGFTQQKRNNTLLALKNKEIQKAHDRSDELLLNILPAQVVKELKIHGQAKSSRHENVSVLFSDFKDFTRIAEKMSPEELVQELDYCFKAFDQIIINNGLEKIKTIGDAYMCAGGLTSTEGNGAVQIVKAAIEMQQFLNGWMSRKKEKNEPCFEARIGIHTGPVVAGIVGMKKYAYDIWGDTVNIASRMEHTGIAGKINISGETYQLLGDSYTCIYRGKLLAKNKGEIDMYFVEDTANG